MKKHFFHREGTWWCLTRYAVSHNWFTGEYLILFDNGYKYIIIDRCNSLFTALLEIKNLEKAV